MNFENNLYRFWRVSTAILSPLGLTASEVKPSQSISFRRRSGPCPPVCVCVFVCVCVCVFVKRWEKRKKRSDIYYSLTHTHTHISTSRIREDELLQWTVETTFDKYN